MNAELKFIFEKIPDNIVDILKQSFNTPTNIMEIISHSIYYDTKDVYDSFVHGFQSTEALILFQIVGNELLVHIEIPPSSSAIFVLKKKINSYYKNIINNLKNNGIETKDIKEEAIIIAENCYMFTGTIPNRNDEFYKQLNKDKFRLIILPIFLFITTYIFYKLKIITDIKTSTISFISQIVAIIVWYLYDYVILGTKKEFSFQNINE